VKYLDEYREARPALALAQRVAALVTRPWVLMEVCGGQTHSIVRYGLDELLPSCVELVHGPGCPVCVTPLATIDRAHAIAARPEVTFCSFGDMLRVPGTHGDLLSLKAQGADVRVVYSPLDALAIAQARPDRQVVFFAIGFETTAPANAMTVWLAQQRKLFNFSVIMSHVRVPPAIVSILQAPDNRVQGFLGPGHVCAVMGVREYEAIAASFAVPIVIAGFEPVDILDGVLRLLQQLEAGTACVDNAYARAVRSGGNPDSLRIVERVFEISQQTWRGIGAIPESGYALRSKFARFDATERFDVAQGETHEPAECISARILRGLAKPLDCPAFGVRCTPDSPLGATMVSAEGSCAAYHTYGRRQETRGTRSLPIVVAT
jgi:hydrogenase expression/formation protein HypD